MNLVMNPFTKKQIDSFIPMPSHALGIFAPKGSGKKSVALYIAEKLLDKKITQNSSFVHIVRPNDKNIISIEDIRGLINYAKLKAIGTNNIKRVIIIFDADYITTEAQNALLKTLEEPSTDTLIILTASDKNALLPTVNSRIKSISLLKPSKNMIINSLRNSYHTKEIEKYWHMSSGRIGLMISLLNTHDHHLLPYIDTAKNLLTITTYERLILIDSLSKQDINLLLEALYILATAGFKQSIIKSSYSVHQKWHSLRKNVFDAQQKSAYNPNTKLLLSNLFLAM